MLKTLVRKAAILLGATTGKYTFTGPDCVLVSITENCNFSCLNCRFHSAHTHGDSLYRPEIKEMPIALVRKIAPELKAAKVGIVVISGSGEPLLHRDFPEILKLLNTTGARIKLLTNGSLLDSTKANVLLDQGIDELRVSLWAKTLDEFKANYPNTNPAFFQKVTSNIKQIAQLKEARGLQKPKLSIHHPLNRNNFGNLEYLPALAEEWGLDEISFSALIPYPEVDQQSLLTDADMPKLHEAMKALIRPLQQRNIGNNIDQTLFQQQFGAKMVNCIGCYNGWFQLRIQEDGLASPCNTCNIFVGNAKESTVLELWRGRKMQEFRERACTFEGLSEIAQDGFCDYCSSYHVNRKIHRIVSRIPFTKAGR